MRFLAYSDIHHDEYGNGLTLADTVAVENEITQFAVSQDIEHVIFAGDWYRATNPLQRVIKAAESTWVARSTYERQNMRQARGVTTYVAVGNHDRETKSALSGHAFAGVAVFRQDLARVWVADTIQHKVIDGIDFLFVPAGHSLAGVQRPTTKPHLVVVFHGMVEGSALAGGGSASTGVPPAEIAALRPSLVLGGDNHTPQSLENLGLPGFYLGAPLQHNWGDQGQVRGWWDISISEGSAPIVNFHPSMSPRFVRLRIEAASEVELLCHVAQELNKSLEGRPGIVEITATGQRAANINSEMVAAQVVAMGMRRCKVSIDRRHEKIEVATGISTAGTVEDKWKLFVLNGTGIPASLKPALLSQMGQWALQQARMTA